MRVIDHDIAKSCGWLHGMFACDAKTIESSVWVARTKYITNGAGSNVFRRWVNAMNARMAVIDLLAVVLMKYIVAGGLMLFTNP